MLQREPRLHAVKAFVAVRIRLCLIGSRCVGHPVSALCVSRPYSGIHQADNTYSTPAHRFTPRPPPIRTRGSFSDSPIAPRSAAGAGGSLAPSSGPAVLRRGRPPPIHTRASFEARSDSPDAMAICLPPSVGRQPSSESSAALRTRQERRGAAEMSQVADRLFVGSETAARSLANLHAHGTRSLF